MPNACLVTKSGDQSGVQKARGASARATLYLRLDRMESSYNTVLRFRVSQFLTVVLGVR